MNHKIPLPHGWKRRIRASVLHILALGRYTSQLNLLDLTINRLIFRRPISLNPFS